MWFFYLNFFLVDIWLTLATWTKSTISNQWAVTSGKKGMVGHMFLSFLELVYELIMPTNVNLNHFSMWRNEKKNYWFESKL